jgi:hypothetical protein
MHEEHAFSKFIEGKSMFANEAPLTSGSVGIASPHAAARRKRAEDRRRNANESPPDAMRRL